MLSLLTRVVVPCHNALGLERPLRCVKKKYKKSMGSAFYTDMGMSFNGFKSRRTASYTHLLSRALVH